MSETESLRGELARPARDGDVILVEISSEQDLHEATRTVRAAAQRAGMRLVDLTMLVTAASELARNCYIHAGGGTVTVERVRREQPPAAGVRLTFTDHGPGIADPDTALSNGYSTGGGLGYGLGGARRLVDEFELDTRTRPPSGTRITIARWAR
jgi:serine/threonine-protein kinase RsbT